MLNEGHLQMRVAALLRHAFAPYLLLSLLLDDECLRG
jgi:hypothetical protein